ncbi:hypothetical protein KQX54_019253 [Cotesia glomerata]|uniref:Uncharacterized protein n=1 Tax=Cotesia glomerata TaxID=32391 RepID=A0AAV7IH26_COTGL|nr:hypothetical protein KQX54_019253 [Cotesia glomerata]
MPDYNSPLIRFCRDAKLDKSHNGKPSRVIHIRNIASEVSESEIINLGMPFGRVTNVLVLKGKNQKQSNHSTTRQSNDQPPFTHYLGKLRFALGTCCGLKRKREFATKATTISTPIIATRDPSSQSLFQSGNCPDSQSSILRIYVIIAFSFVLSYRFTEILDNIPFIFSQHSDSLFCTKNLLFDKKISDVN